MTAVKFKAKKQTIWDSLVPIVEDKEAKTIDVFITDEINYPNVYNELFYKTVTAPKEYIITLHLNTPGGVIDGALLIIDAINKTKATVNAKLTGTVASAGTIIALACHNLEIAEHTSFMIHNYSGGMQGKGHEMKAHQEFVDKNLNKAFSNFYGGFLTEKEIESVIDGKDLWLNKEDVDERWKARKDFQAL